MTTFTISSGELFSKCEKLARVINSKNSLPVLDNFLFEVDGYNMKITAADSENHAIAELELNDKAEAANFGIAAKTFVAALKELPEQPITITIDGNECNIKYSNGQFNVPVASVDEYPHIPKLREESSLTITAEAYKRIIAKASAFVTIDELRPTISGICFNFKDKLEAVGSDGHALIRLTEEYQGGGEGTFIMSLKTAKLSETYLGKNTGDVQISYTATHLHIKVEGFDLYSRLINGKYPNYNSVIPTNYTQYIEFNRTEMLNGVKRVSVFSNVASRLLRFSLQGMQLNISGNDYDFSTKAEETMMVDKYGNDMNIGLKADLTMTVLNSYADERLKMHYMDQSRAVIFTAVEDTESNHSMLILLMPMMLNE